MGAITDTAIQRAILQYGYEHRHELNFDIDEIEVLGAIGDEQLFYNVRVLRDLGLVNPIDITWKLLEMTTPGLLLVENKSEFNARFSIDNVVPQETKRLVDTLTELMKNRFDPALRQFNKARKFLYEDTPPDYLNSVKESVGAVEAVARDILNQPDKTLAQLITVLKDRYLGHPAMAKILDGIYAVRGDEPGVAHGSHKASSLGHADAEFLLNMCASIIIYLVRKSKRGS
jgi:hypothetical protein